MINLTEQNIVSQRKRTCQASWSLTKGKDQYINGPEEIQCLNFKTQQDHKNKEDREASQRKRNMILLKKVFKVAATYWPNRKKLMLYMLYVLMERAIINLEMLLLVINLSFELARDRQYFGNRAKDLMQHDVKRLTHQDISFLMGVHRNTISVWLNEIGEIEAKFKVDISPLSFKR